MAENIHTPEQASRREWVGLCVLSIACLIYSMDLSVLFLAVPAIVADLDPSASQLLWINDIYGFMVAGFLVTMGTLGDRIGRRRVLLMGAFAFGVASAFAAFSNTPGNSFWHGPCLASPVRRSLPPLCRSSSISSKMRRSGTGRSASGARPLRWAASLAPSSAEFCYSISTGDRCS